ncbi:MAG: hypothetical protein ACK5ME_11570 [Parahaliea sp.]
MRFIAAAIIIFGTAFDAYTAENYQLHIVPTNNSSPFLFEVVYFKQNRLQLRDIQNAINPVYERLPDN